MKRYIRAIIYLIFSIVKFTWIKIFHFSNFKFTFLTFFSPITELDLSGNSKVVMKKNIRARSGVKLKVRNSGSLIIGEGTSFNHGCIIVCHEKIKIGDNVQFGPNVFVYDHDHDFRAKNGLGDLKYKTSPVTIGDNVWIGANVVILRGTTIGDNSVIGAGAVIKGNYSDNSIIIQKKTEIISKYSNEGAL